MSDRSVTIWNLLVGFTIVSLIATSFTLFPMYKKYDRVKERSSNLQFGTDKELEDIISYLEERLELRSAFQFVIENTGTCQVKQSYLSSKKLNHWEFFKTVEIHCLFATPGTCQVKQSYLSSKKN